MNDEYEQYVRKALFLAAPGRSENLAKHGANRRRQRWLSVYVAGGASCLLGWWLSLSVPGLSVELLAGALIGGGFIAIVGALYRA